MESALHIALLAGCGIWFVQATMLLIHLTQLRSIGSSTAPPPERWPTVSAVVPARDEARTIATALRSRLHDDYPQLELVVVDDRSVDATPSAVAEVAASDDRVVAVRVDELPAGWLGKVHALHVGVGVATGEWLLISDADVHITKGGLRRCVAYCIAEKIDFLALVPEFRSPSFLVDVIWTVFMRVLATSVSPRAVRSSTSKAAMGSGGFMLARREVFDRTPGYEYLRMETTDDVALGVMMKRAGGSCDFVNGYGIAQISIYHKVGEFLRGVEKNAGSLAQAPFVAVLAVIAVAGALEYSPLIALASPIPAVRLAGLASLVVATTAAISASWVNNRTAMPALLWPLGWLLVAGGILRSAWLLRARGGVVWRDTFYSTEEILAGQRFRIM